MQGPLTPAEMVELVTRSLEAEHSVSAVVKTRPRNPYPTITLSTTRDPGRWVRLDLCDEVFIVDVDLGFGLVESELAAPEQTEVLAELVDLGTAYLRGDWHIEHRRTVLGRTKQQMAVSGASQSYLLKELRRRTKENETPVQ